MGTNMQSQTAKLHWHKIGKRLHAKHGAGAYQIHIRDDGRFEVVHFATPKSAAVLRATAGTLQGAQDYVAIEVSKQPAV
jgi:hypothetical protein